MLMPGEKLGIGKISRRLLLDVRRQQFFLRAFRLSPISWSICEWVGAERGLCQEDE
jgi:hypothetical protein